MNSKKKKLFEESYERIINVGFCIAPYEDLSDIIASDPVVFGTTKDERIFSIEEVDTLFKSQFEQMGSMDPELERKRIATRISADGNNAFIVEEITLSISSPEAVNTIFMRASCVMEYIDNRWKLTHWHTSTPVDTENDHWHMEEWKREKEKLQQLVDQQTDDLKKQKRELEIDASLERVRAQTMAMHNSEDVGKCIVKMFAELTALGVDEGTRFGIGILNHDNENNQLWTAKKDGEEVKMHIGNLDMNAHPLLKIARKAWKEQIPFHKYVLEGEDLLNYYRMLNTAPDYKIQISIEKLPKREIQHCFIFEHGFFYAFSAREFQPELIDTIQRFSSQFAQTYRRYLDLLKAEGQAREAEIELALERVRARTMAMQHSDELQEASFLLDQQVRTLGIKTWGCAFNIYGDNESTEWFGNEAGVLPTYTVPREGIFKDYYDKGQKGASLFIQEFSGDACVNHYEYMSSLPVIGDVLKELKRTNKGFPTYQLDHVVYFKYGYLLFITKEPVPESHDIFQRFAKVFEQTYTRFLDLQKAEAQAREAQIEAALERVRSRSLAMHHTNELQNVIHAVHRELVHLNVAVSGGSFIVINSEIDTELKCWGSGGTAETSDVVHIPYYNKPFYTRILKGIKSGTEFFTEAYSQEEKVAFFKFLFEHEPWSQLSAKQKKETLLAPGGYIRSVSVSRHTSIFMINHFGENFSENDNAILKRFGKVFEQAYTRFLDLQKAETQARESKIETALEKVRSRTMGMQSSDELPEVANLLFLEVQGLGIPAWSCGYCILLEDKKSSTCIMSSEGTLQKPFDLPHSGEVSFEEWNDFMHSDETFLTQELGGKAIESHYAFMKSLPQLKPIFKEIEDVGLSLPTYQINHLCKFNQGFLLFITYKKVPDAHDIFLRFTKVFDQTYTRFLDLQKAEAQARKAQIENALEKVRSRSLAMQHPDELVEVAQLLREEMGGLGVEELETSSIYIYDKNSRKTQCWFTIKDTEDPDKSVTDQMTIDLQDTWVGREMHEFYDSGMDNTSILMKGVHRVEWIRYCEEKSELFGTSEFYGDSIPDRTYHLCKFSSGFLGAASPGSISDESWDLMKRATGVFSFAYTRFRDLQKAEESARRSRQQASLDRVRADISSMRSADDLNRVTPLIWNELTTLGVPFIRCGVFIIHEDVEQIEVYLSKPDGTSLAVMHLPFGSSELATQTVSAWKKERVLKMQWTREEFLEWGKSMMEQGQVSDLETYRGAKEAPESLNLNFIPFNQGMLYVGSTGLLNDEEISLSESLAKAFSIAYARYEDFIKLEKAKAKIEDALTELKATQSQLVQQEKLASLGQLTAGIAHEIKNPLNFVNNFSEVSREMMQEVREEIETVKAYRDRPLPGDALDEMSAILDDIESNLEKIHHHGTRADSIVKSMLQHSRGGSGKMEPTDLNALIKEYVNLAFHGMRAKKNPINAEIDLQLDPKIKTVSLIGEDFSRVILNLTNNAFDAMRETVNERPAKLTVRTKQESNAIHIEVEDNGSGIPNAIKDKILQPFFTTKKGTEGTGLGLSITHDIVKAHGGELTIETSLCKGSVFTIELAVK